MMGLRFAPKNSSVAALEYGSSAYLSARLRNLKKLDAVHHNGIRIALRAFRSSRIEKIMYIKLSSTNDVHQEPSG
jgi:hypothetical protein